MVLLIGSGLFVQTLARLHGNLGFDSTRLLTVSIDPPAKGYSEPDAERAMRDVLERLQALPVVERAAIANGMILTGGAASSSVAVWLASIVTIWSATIANRASARAIRACTAGGSRAPAQSRTPLHQAACCRMRAVTRHPLVASQLPI